MLEGEPKEAEEKEEIVVKVILKGGCDVFFSSQYSGLAKACHADAAQSLESGGRGVGITQLRDSPVQWMRDHQTFEGVSQTGAGASGAAATTPARIFL